MANELIFPPTHPPKRYLLFSCAIVSPNFFYINSHPLGPLSLEHGESNQTLYDNGGYIWVLGKIGEG